MYLLDLLHVVLQVVAAAFPLHVMQQLGEAISAGDDGNCRFRSQRRRVGPFLYARDRQEPASLAANPICMGDLSRRRFLQLVGLASAAAALAPRRGFAGLLGSNTLSYDDGSSAIPGGLTGPVGNVIVIGAGFAGLAVANALGNAGVPCVVLEGRDRIGGRAHTVDVSGAAVDLGCSWITDPAANPMTQFATQAGVLQTNASIELDVPESRFYDARNGVVLQTDTMQSALHALRYEEYDSANISSKLGPNATTKDGILRYISDQALTGDPARYAEFFLRLVTELPDATDWDLDSLKYWANYNSPYYGFGEGDFPVGGYTRLVQALGGGADVRLQTRVTDVIADTSGVQVLARDANDAPVTFTGSHVVVTVPLGVLKSSSIAFSPTLPSNKQNAITRLGMGTFEKVVMRFPEPYWATEHAHIFHLSDPNPMEFPLIVDYFFIEKQPILVAFNTGSHAIALDGVTETEIRARMLDVLTAVQGGPIPDPTDVVVTRWGNDPFSHGSYSYIPVGATPADQTALAAPVAGRILFAGEASSKERFGYADGAFSTGIREAKRLLGSASVQLRAY